MEPENFLSTELKTILSKYAQDPLTRTIDLIPSNAVFLCHVLCAMVVGDVPALPEDQMKELFALIAEEEMRRKQPWSSKTLTEGDLEKMMYQEIMGDCGGGNFSRREKFPPPQSPMISILG